MPSLDEKRQNAIDASQALIDLLVRCGELHWPARIHRIRDALNDYELDRAVRFFESLPMGGMGGLLDLYLCAQNSHTVRDVAADNKTLEALVGALAKTIANLRVYMEYEIDNPLVSVPDAS